MHRLILSRYPTVGVFDHLVQDEQEARIAFLLEQATNPRLSEASDRLARLPPGAVITAANGQGASLVMAAFLHTTEAGGRFHTGDLGAWYAARDIDTAVAETLYHNERRLRLSEGGFPNRVQLRELVATLGATLPDVRGGADQWPDLYHPTDYTASQAFAHQRRWPIRAKSWDGLIYDSVRRAGGENIALFRPAAVPLPVLQARHFQYDWDKAGAVTVTRLDRIG